MQEINSGAFSHDFFDLQHTASTPTSASPCRRASPPSSVTSPTSPPPKHLCKRVFTNSHGKPRRFASANTLARGGFTDTFGIHTNIYSTKHLCRRVFGKRGFTIILAQYNDSRALTNSFGINAYGGSLPSPSMRGYINSFDTKVYHTFINCFDSRGSLATLVQTSTSTTMTTSTTPREIEDLVMSTGKRG